MYNEENIMMNKQII